MKFRSFLLLSFFLLTAFSFAQTTKQKSDPRLSRPKLVVGLVVDQMRWDYLYRYFDRYQGGLKRMLNEGFTCENTFIDYIPTVTAIGHSSIYTGSVPAIHGIAGNDFVIQATGKLMYCTEDTIVSSVGAVSDAGKMSPRNLLVTTITDELKLATNFRSKTIGIALKDRGAILPAGHLANAAYWFDDKSGNWISSTYYMKKLPNWVETFNSQKVAEKYLKQDWTTLYPISSYKQSLPDSNKYEGKFSGASGPTFPVKTSTLLPNGTGSIRSTPYGNSFTLDLAKAAVENEGLGKGTDPDFLAVSLSSTDYVGHQFGPNSIEVEDTYLRLDRDLAAFFSFLDAKVGKGNYTVFLSADHGAAHNANFLTDKNIPAGLWPSKQILDGLNSLFAAKYKIENLVLNLDNYQVNFNNPLILKNKIDLEDLKKEAIQFLKDKPGVAYALDQTHAATSAIPEEIKNRIINGYNSERSGVIQIILKSGWYSGGATGTTHGTWNPYDAHIPLLWMGWGIHHGSTNAMTNMTDISATLAALLRIQMPNGCIGKPIIDVLK